MLAEPQLHPCTEQVTASLAALGNGTVHAILAFSRGAFCPSPTISGLKNICERSKINSPILF